MATVAAPTTNRKPTAFYATFHGLSGVITKPADHVLFLEHESGAVVTISQADEPDLVVLGEVESAMAQYIADMATGGYAAVACSREMGGAVMSTPTLTPDRTAWRQAVAEIAAKAHAKLPECNGRIDSAVKIVLAGDVELLPDGGARVASRTDATVHYHTVNGHCDCKDFPRAPGKLCAHRLAYGIARRAAELLPPPPEPLLLPPAPAVRLPEAPASANCYVMLEGRQVQVTLRDSDETRLLQRLAALLQQYPALQPPAQGQPTGQSRDKGWCQKHQVAMKLNHGKDGRSWWSHRTAEGHWCKGK